MAMDPKLVYTRVLQKTDMPKHICQLDNKHFEENSFRNIKNPKNKIDQQQLRADKNKELLIRDLKDGEIWEDTFKNVEQGQFQFDEKDEVTKSVNHWATDVVKKSVELIAETGDSEEQEKNYLPIAGTVYIF